MRVEDDYEFPEQEEHEVVPEGKTLAEESYGPIMEGRYYKILDSGYDWKRISHRGRPMYVPYWVFEK